MSADKDYSLQSMPDLIKEAVVYDRNLIERAVEGRCLPSELKVLCEMLKNEQGMAVLIDNLPNIIALIIKEHLHIWVSSQDAWLNGSRYTTKELQVDFMGHRITTAPLGIG